jgi:NAD(P)-dependent dehydrogenase (short-subunit alcohol dehydrogenase family)
MAGGPHFDVNGSVVVVTGASSGLGRRMAIEFVNAGATVVGLARRRPLLESLETELRRRSSASATMACDVSDTEQFMAALDAITTEHQRIDVLVNNAGVGDPTEGEDIAGYRSVMETNYFARSPRR